MSVFRTISRNLNPSRLATKLGFDRLSRTGLVTAGIVVAIVLFLSINVASTNVFRSARADLTANNLYTLSKGTRELLAKIEEPIRLRLFLSKGLLRQAPTMAAYANRVQSMLETYVDLSGGKLKLDVIDPKPYSDEEDRAVGLGINRIRLTSEADEVFFGLAATNSTDGRAQIPVFSPDREAFLEYDLTRLIAKLSQPSKPVLAIVDGIALSGNPMARQPESQILQQLRELFEIEQLAGDVDKLPDNTRVVLLAHPKNLSDRTLFTIDQWVLSGGATLVFADPHAETQPGLRPGMPPQNPKTEFEKMFKAWGVTFDTDKAVGDPAYALTTQREVDGRVVNATNLPWLALRPPAFAADDALLAQLSSIVMTTAGGFATTSDKTVLVPLITASDSAGYLPTENAASQYGDPRELLAKLEKPEKPIVLAARLDGSIATAFPDGKPKGSAFEGEALKQPAAPINVILVGDADMLSDRNWIRQRQILGQQIAEAFANNGAFVLNAVEQMSGGTVLADLRGRELSWRPFEKIQALERDAEARYLEKQQKLLAKLRETEERMRQLANEAGKDGDLVTPETTQAVDQFRSSLLATRAELRDVQYNLRSDVESLKSWLTTLNVGVFPALIAVFALMFALRTPRRPLPERHPETSATRVA